MSAPRLMGVVNATPDSFSDIGGEDPIDRAGMLIEAGAELIDVGGESGITGVPAVEATEEIARVVPVVERISALGVDVSVDTYKPEVARAAIHAGARMVNDVSGLRDPELADVCAETGAALVVMHTYAPPKEKVLDRRHDATVVDDVVAFLAERMALAESRGVAREQVLFDPGPDFGKTPWQTVEVLRALPRLVALGRPVLLAVSRKDFVGVITGRRPRERDPGTLAAIAAGVDAGASILRVHDVRGVADFLAVRDVLAGRREVPPDAALPVELRRERTS